MFGIVQKHVILILLGICFQDVVRVQGLECYTCNDCARDKMEKMNCQSWMEKQTIAGDNPLLRGAAQLLKYEACSKVILGDTVSRGCTIGKQDACVTKSGATNCVCDTDNCNAGETLNISWIRVMSISVVTIISTSGYLSHLNL